LNFIKQSNPISQSSDFIFFNKFYGAFGFLVPNQAAKLRQNFGFGKTINKIFKKLAAN